MLFALKQDIGGVLRAANSGKDTDVYDIAKTANFIRKDLLKVKNTFNGTFAENCQRESIPASLRTLLRMIMKSPTTEGDESQACITVLNSLLSTAYAEFMIKSQTDLGNVHFPSTLH